MSGIGSIVEAVITSSLLKKRSSAPPVNPLEWLLIAFCCFCAVAGFVFIMIALYKYLQELYMPSMAAFFSSLTVFGAALIAMMIRAASLRLKKPPVQKTDSDGIKDDIYVLIKDILGDLEDPVRENPKTAVALAALAGLFMTRRL